MNSWIQTKTFAMSDLIIRREHNLGLERVRHIGRSWNDYVARKLEMSCTYEAGQTSDRAEFSRVGVRGVSILTDQYVEIRISLGLLFKPFAGQIESELTRRLDQAIAKERAKG